MSQSNDKNRDISRDKNKLSGFGVGLRAEHYKEILENKPAIDWFEIITENYLVSGGKALYYVEAIREQYPMAMHGVSLSIGSTDPLNLSYLKQVKTLAELVQPAFISDHLCWTGVNGVNTHDLLPLPYTEEAIFHVAERVRRVQDYLGQQILLENVSSYLEYCHSSIPEWEFLKAVAEEADCFILLDINNIYVSSVNHHYDPLEYLKVIPTNRVKQFHVSGLYGENKNEAVFALYAQALRRFGSIPTMVEQDEHFLPLKDLIVDVAYVKDMSKNIMNEARIQDGAKELTRRFTEQNFA